ncbi:MAG: HvfC family RiPP maturation protein [Methylosarcina sp.]
MAIDFKEKQREFSDYIRNPQSNPAPADVDIRRMAMYRELFFNNIESFLSGNFPVLRSLLDDARWLALVQDFFAEHVCQTPYFSEIAEEFLAYVQYERKQPGDLPFMLELAHYEWVEMALANSKDELIINKPDLGDLLGKKISLSSLAWPLVYRFPVHRISSSFLPLSPQDEPVCLIVYRNLDDRVRFIEITPATYSLLQLLQENDGQPTEFYLNQMIMNLQPPEPELIREGGLKVLTELAEKNIITVIA